MSLKMPDLRRRMNGRDAIVRLRNRLETSQGRELEQLVTELEALASPPTPPATARVLKFPGAAA